MWTETNLPELRSDMDTTSPKLVAAQKRKLCIDRQRTKKTHRFQQHHLQQLATHIQIVDTQRPMVGYPTPDPSLMYISPVPSSFGPFSPYPTIGFLSSPTVICLPVVSLPSPPSTSSPIPSHVPPSIPTVGTREEKLERYRAKRSSRTYSRPKDQKRQMAANARRRESNGHFLPNLPPAAPVNISMNDECCPMTDACETKTSGELSSIEKASIRFILNL